MHKPAGHSSVSPYLIVDNVEATIAFLKTVFGAEPGLIHRNEDGSIGHAEVKIDDTVVMMGEGKGGPGAHVHVYVPNVDATFTKACEAGGTAVQEPDEKGDGDRRGGVKDRCGTTWWVSTMVSGGR